MTTADNLRTALDLFGPNGEYWSVGQIESDLNAHDVVPLPRSDGSSTCYCAHGAVNKTVFGDSEGPHDTTTTRDNFRDTYRVTPEKAALAESARGLGYVQPDISDRINYDASTVMWKFNDTWSNRIFDRVKEVFEHAIVREDSK
jgi:hypothetical protein